MEDKLESNRKRQFFENDDSEKPPAEKRVRFPKGKKVKPAAVDILDLEDGDGSLKNPHRAAKERAIQRNPIVNEDGDIPDDISAAEVAYEDNENFVDDGIKIEPFNLNKEREEGYFDESGNFVEFVNDDEIKDAWLDSVEADIAYTGISSATTNYENNSEDERQDLSTREIGMIKRRIADVLEPGETVLQALRRLKGASNNRKEKMSAETKRLFDQLTEDAMKLMENDVYQEKQELFQREAEGYEKLAMAKGKDISVHVGLGNSEHNLGIDTSTDITDPGISSSLLPDSAVGTSNSNLIAADTSSNAADGYDMFADDEDGENLKSSSEPIANAGNRSSSDFVDSAFQTGDMQNDYVYDESSGYYYSSSLGYYYDPSSGLYCAAASGQWYSFNEASGTYDEVQDFASSTN